MSLGNVTLGKVLLATALVGGGAHLLKAHQHHVRTSRLASVADSYGFVPIVAAADTPPNTVVILAARNCPSAQARRADLMASQLTQMQIPNMRASNYALGGITRDQVPMIEQTNAVLGGEVPIVIVNGKAKANPSVSDVVSEFRSRI